MHHQDGWGKFVDLGVMDSAPNIRNKTSGAIHGGVSDPMSYRNRGILAAFAGIAALLATFGSGLYLGGLAKIYQERAATLNASQCPTPILEGPGIAASPTEDWTAGADNQAYYNCEDLRAQREMAVWTKRMGQAAIIGVVLSIVGIWLIWRTWDATRQAAEVGRDANAIALNQMRSQLVCDGGEFQIEGDSAFFRFMVRNTGRIVAQNCRARLELMLPAKIGKDGIPTEGSMTQWIMGKPGFNRAVRSGHSETIDLRFTSIETPHPPTGTTIIHPYYMDKLRDKYYQSAALYLSWEDELGPRRGAQFTITLKAGSVSTGPDGATRGVYLSKAR